MRQPELSQGMLAMAEPDWEEPGVKRSLAASDEVRVTVVADFGAGVKFAYSTSTMSFASGGMYSVKAGPVERTRTRSEGAKANPELVESTRSAEPSACVLKRTVGTL